MPPTRTGTVAPLVTMARTAAHRVGARLTSDQARNSGVDAVNEPCGERGRERERHTHTALHTTTSVQDQAPVGYQGLTIKGRKGPARAYASCRRPSAHAPPLLAASGPSESSASVHLRRPPRSVPLDVGTRERGHRHSPQPGARTG